MGWMGSHLIRPCLVKLQRALKWAGGVAVQVERTLLITAAVP